MTDKERDNLVLRELAARYVADPSVIQFHHVSGGLHPYILTRWHLNEGDSIGFEDIIATIETQTFSISIEVFCSGIVSKLFYRVGDVIPDGATIAHIAIDGDRSA